MAAPINDDLQASRSRKLGCWTLYHPLDAWNGQIPILRVLGITEALTREDVGEGVAQTEELKKCHVPNQIIIQEIDRGNAHILCVYSCTVYNRIYVRMIPYGQTYVYSIQDTHTHTYIYMYIYMYIYLHWDFFHHKQICYESFSVLLCVFPSEAVLLVPPLKGFGGFQEDSRSSSGGDEGLSPEQICSCN